MVYQVGQTRDPGQNPGTQMMATEGRIVKGETVVVAAGGPREGI